LSAAYTETIRHWAIDTRRAGTLEAADGIGEIGLGEDEVGRRLAVRFAVKVNNGSAMSVRYQVYGCGFTIAACAVAAELAEGRSLAEALCIDTGTIEAALGGLPQERSYCAQLAVEALHAAVTSALNGRNTVTSFIAAKDDHIPRVTQDNRVYRLLIDSPSPSAAPSEDRHLFACALAVAATEPYDITTALGLSKDDLHGLLRDYFPPVTLTDLEKLAIPAIDQPPLINHDILALLASYLPQDDCGHAPSASQWLVQMLAARSAHSGHLWRAMGLFERPELTNAIRRHLPKLAYANEQGMRWKRFLFKRLCDLSGGNMCKTPDCGVCSDYALCFPVAE